VRRISFMNLHFALSIGFFRNLSKAANFRHDAVENVQTCNRGHAIRISTTAKRQQVYLYAHCLARIEDDCSWWLVDSWTMVYWRHKCCCHECYVPEQRSMTLNKKEDGLKDIEQRDLKWSPQIWKSTWNCPGTSPTLIAFATPSPHATKP